MLAAIDVRVYPNDNATLPHPCAHMLHGAILNLVRSEDPEISKLLHDDAQVKPFSISTLWPRIRANADTLQIPKYTECRFRIGTASSSVFDVISKPLFALFAEKGAINIGGHPFIVLDAGMDGVFGGIASYSDLLKSIGKSVEMRFSSPLSFKRRGINVPIPDPLLVYGSLWQKWQALSDVQVDEAVYEEMIESVALSGMDGHTRVWKFPHNMFVGFVGVAKYELVKKVSDDSEKLFGALSQLAFFTGVGAKTTMGLGQCKILQMSDFDDTDAEAQ